MTVSPVHGIDWDAFVAAIDGVEVIQDPHQVSKLSQDYYTFSPVLQAVLADKTGDIVVRPATEEQVIQVAAECAKRRIPVTIRGAGTGNYGQCVPLAGGVILDMSHLNQICWIKPGLLRVQAGAKLAAIDKATRPEGWELRMVPSTYRTATIGGFIAGGSGGIGSILYGQLRDRGSLIAVKVITLEEKPRVLELRGDDVQKVNHAYGTNGIITELEIPLGVAYNWVDCIVTFDDFMTAARFGQALGDADPIIKKLISAHAWPIPSYFAALQSFLPDQQHAVLVMIADTNLEPFHNLVQAWGGTITYEKAPGDPNRKAPLLEFSWNHSTLHARSVDPALTYLQTMFPYDPELKLVRHMYDYFGDEVMMHIEFVRSHGRVIPAALQIVRYSTEERLNEIIRYHEAQGAFIANPHTYILEDGGRKTIDTVQVNFKQEVDPYGLLNPGKMRGWIERSTSRQTT